MGRERPSVARQAKEIVLDNAARLAPLTGRVPGIAAYLYQHDHPLLALIERYGVDEVLDVGANQGQFAAKLRLLGYRGRIVSFEPVSAAFERLRARAAHDRSWDVVHTAVGDARGEAEIHVTANTALSSMLSPSEEFADRDPDAAVVYSERVPVDTLDALVDAGARGHTVIKIDAQGSEASILDGARRVLDGCAGVELELSLRTPFYEGEGSADELRARLEAHGLTEVVLNPLSHTLRWGDLVQADAIFWRLAA
jgi:FkbM family methyltransferase